MPTWEQLAMFVLEWITFCDQLTSRTQSLWPSKLCSTIHWPLWSSRKILTTLSHPPETILLAFKLLEVWFSSTGNAGAQLTDVQPVFIFFDLIKEIKKKLKTKIFLLDEHFLFFLVASFRLHSTRLRLLLRPSFRTQIWGQTQKAPKRLCLL